MTTSAQVSRKTIHLNSRLSTRENKFSPNLRSSLRRLSTENKKAEKSVAESQENIDDALMNAPLTTQEKISSTFWLSFLALGG